MESDEDEAVNKGEDRQCYLYCKFQQQGNSKWFTQDIKNIKIRYMKTYGNIKGHI